MDSLNQGGCHTPQFDHAPPPKQLALAFAELGRTCFPCSGKKPVLKWTPYQTQAPTTQQVQNWWAQHPRANMAIPTGALNGLTVVDVDGCGHAPETLPKLLELIGPTPLVVQTAGGGYHLYYKHKGERNGQGWELEGFSGDIRGEGGYIMAAGSVHPDTQQTYRIEGDLDWFLEVLHRLPTLQRELPKKALQQGEKPTEGGRNSWLFGEAIKLAVMAGSKADLEALVLDVNASLPIPLEMPEAVRVAGRAWGYKERGTLMAQGEQFIKLTKSEWQRFSPDEVYLLAMLRLANALRPQFVIAQEQVARDVLRWGQKRLRNALRGLLAAGVIVCVHKGGKTKGDTAKYVWGSL